MIGLKQARRAAAEKTDVKFPVGVSANSSAPRGRIDAASQTAVRANTRLGPWFL